MQSDKILAALSRHPRLKRFLVITYEAIAQILFAMPRYPVFNAIKSAYLRLNGAHIGARVIYYPGVWIAPGRNLTVGDDVDFARGVIVETAGGVEIGDRTLIGYGAVIMSGNHEIPPNRGRIFYGGYRRAKIIIGSDVWIGANSVILPGRSIGDGAVIGAGSIVTKDVEPYHVVVGTPARTIKVRN